MLASTTSPSPSTASVPARVRAGGTFRSRRQPAARVDVHHPCGGAGRQSAASTTRSPGSSPGIGAEIMGPGSGATPDGTRTRREGRGGPEPAVPYTRLRPHPPRAPVDRDGGRHDVPLPRRVAGRGAGPRGCGRPGRPQPRGPSRAPRPATRRGSGTSCRPPSRSAGACVGEHEHRRVERRVRTPCALPLRVLLPAGVAELPGTHDLGADPRRSAGRRRRRRRRYRCRLSPPPGVEHPFVQPFPGVTEMRSASDPRRCRSRRARWRSCGRGRVTWVLVRRVVALQLRPSASYVQCQLSC